MKDFLPYIAIVFSGLSFLLAVLTFVRAGRWKEGETLKAVVEQVGRHEARLAAGDEKLENLATKADVAGLKAEVAGLEKTTDKIEGAVVRIERHLMGVRHD